MTRNTPEGQVRYAKTRNWSLLLFNLAIILPTTLTKWEQEQAAPSGDRLRLSRSDRADSALMPRRFDHTWVLRATDLRITLVMLVREGVFA